MSEPRHAWTVDGQEVGEADTSWAKLAFRERGPCLVVRVPISERDLAGHVAGGSRLKIERVSALGDGARLAWWEGSIGDVVIHADHVEAASYPDVDPRWLDEEGCVA